MTHTPEHKGCCEKCEIRAWNSCGNSDCPYHQVGEISLSAEAKAIENKFFRHKEIEPEWEAEFDKEYSNGDRLEMKNLIRSLFSSEKDRLARVVEGMRPILWNDDPNKHLRNIVRAEALTDAAAAIRTPPTKINTMEHKEDIVGDLKNISDDYRGDPIDRELDKAIEECIGIMGTEAYRGSYAASREAFRKILSQIRADAVREGRNGAVDAIKNAGESYRTSDNCLVVSDSALESARTSSERV